VTTCGGTPAEGESDRIEEKRKRVNKQGANKQVRVDVENCTDHMSWQTPEERIGSKLNE
jgi:hypothetical protein